MVSQTGDSFDCFTLGRWDPTIVPLYSDESGGAWTFTYNGAQDCGNPNRQWQPTFLCDPNVEYQIADVTEPFTCLYEVDVRTKVFSLHLIFTVIYPLKFDDNLSIEI